MSGYFETNMASGPTRKGVRVGSDDGVFSSKALNNNSTSNTNNSNNITNAAAAAAMFEQLAAAMQNNQGTNSSLQEEDVARMGMMLTRLMAADDGANNGKNNNKNNNNHRIPALNDDRRRAAPSQRSYFNKESRGPSRTSYGPASARLHPQQQHRLRHQQQKIAPKMSNQQQQQWYSEERSLLRELIVLTMRHSDGNLLRYVPSEEEQLQLWNTHGHPVGNRFAPNIVAEGVRIFPNVNVVPEWRNSQNDHDDNEVFVGVKEDIEFRANLQMPLLGSGARDAISLCGECGWLYGRVSSHVETVLEEDVDGVQCATARALAARMDNELEEYHRHLSLLESELPPLELELSLPSIQSSSSAPLARYLTLRSLASRLSPIRDHLRTLAILADGVGACNLRGGKLLATVLRHSLDGHTRHTDLARSIAADCSVPWYKLLSQWITQGVLTDVHSEFFVKEIKPEAMEKGIITSSGFFTWHQRYVLVEGQIPLCSCGGLMDIITVDLAREVLDVGKGINFIRYCLQDKEWEVLEKEDESLDSDGAVHQSYNFATLMDVSDNDNEDEDELRCVSTLHDAVMKSSARIHSHILESLEKHHHMRQHLLALKHFLFLGQGDFVSSFVESLNQEFRGRTSIAGIYSHTLSAVLEGSLRTTNARFLPNFVLGNLSARLMMDKHDPNQYWMGPPPKAKKETEMIPWEDNEASIQDPWDFIYLEYKINSPLDAIVHTSAMETYHQVSCFLLRLKRVEWLMNNSWRQSTALNHAILIETKAGGADAPAICEAAEHSSFLLRRISSTRQTMLHFISNLQNYLMFEVLEGGWEGLVLSMSKAQSLDDIIRAHDSYLNEIVDKTLLTNEDGQNSNGKSLENLLRKLLSIALKFGKFQDHIFSNSLAGLDKAAKIRRKVEERAAKGDWGRTTLDKEEGRVFLYLADAKLFEFVEHTANDFDVALSDLLKTMSKQIDEVDCNASMDDDQEETDLVMKNHDALPFLLFRLDFSGYYARQARENRKKKKQNHN
mmetsp:Transcript_6822/g.15582  ORF Transcript_6822/g.15582 Transcript_6822/m.15582 type:complete len:1011 (+) Transcript_6822:124-3156(+)